MSTITKIFDFIFAVLIGVIIGFTENSIGMGMIAYSSMLSLWILMNMNK